MSKHPIVHVELPAHDPAAAAKFYADLFGWQIQRSEQDDYTMFQAEGGPGGGFNRVGHQVGHQQTKPGDVLVYVDTDDIDATLRTAEALGGKTLLPKTEIPQMGWYAIFADPTGNRVGLFTGQMG